MAMWIPPSRFSPAISLSILSSGFLKFYLTFYGKKLKSNKDSLKLAVTCLQVVPKEGMQWQARLLSDPFLVLPSVFVLMPHTFQMHPSDVEPAQCFSKEHTVSLWCCKCYLQCLAISGETQENTLGAHFGSLTEQCRPWRILSQR